MNEDCRKWRTQLDAFLTGSLPSERRDRMREHLASCEECRTLLADSSLQNHDPGAEAGQDLTDAVLARTSGKACEQAATLIAADAGDAAQGLDAELLQTHIDHCRDCEALSTAMAWVDAVLPEMAEIEPAAGFVEEVLLATSEARDTAPPIRERLELWWQRLYRRPRFALEAAYVATVILILLFALPFSPGKSTPERARDAFGDGRTTLSASMAPNLGAIRADLRREGARIREWNRTRVAPRLRALGEEVDARGNLVASAAAELGPDFGALIEALLQDDGEATRSGLKRIGGDLENIWRGVLGEDAAHGNPESEIEEMSR